MAPLEDFLDDITPSDTEDLPFPVRTLRVLTTAGDIRVKTSSGNDRTFHAIVPGEYTSPVRIVRVYATGTDAVGIEGY